MKVFAASIAACLEVDGRPGSTHTSALLIYESIEDAAAEASRIAFLRWKEKDGWYGHWASISAASSAFYEAYAVEVSR